MLPHRRVAEVRRLLADGRFSQRRIAQMTGTSRGTVAAIAQGRGPARGRGRASRGETDPAAGAVERCPGCGARVQMPCLLCRLRTAAPDSTWQACGPAP